MGFTVVETGLRQPQHKPPKRNDFNKKLKNRTKKHTSKVNLKRGLKFLLPLPLLLELHRG